MDIGTFGKGQVAERLEKTILGDEKAIRNVGGFLMVSENNFRRISVLCRSKDDLSTVMKFGRYFLQERVEILEKAQQIPQAAKSDVLALLHQIYGKHLQKIRHQAASA